MGQITLTPNDKFIIRSELSPSVAVGCSGIMFYFQAASRQFLNVPKKIIEVITQKFSFQILISRNRTTLHFVLRPLEQLTTDGD